MGVGVFKHVDQDYLLRLVHGVDIFAKPTKL